ncbi:hypothetical protein EZV62_025041 [Acer yangbiense]|uniref:F-box domain-containing protein n=1 Tax=Acer yangbiense TaxID=1000413 RepID=A0A5C7GYS9_9ROSI|nr:hypothetical protein EZV62_025041 [Acer yangbiense]
MEMGPIKKVKISDEMEMDRLSNLPDSVIHHILSLMDAKYAVQTCILSKKWKFHWAHVPCYSFDYSTSSSDIQFQDFVANVLNNRQSFNLSRPRFRVSGDVTMSSFVKTFYHYVLSCRFEELDDRKKVQISDQMAVDRLSSLPDTIIHHILSLMETKYAIRTCVLSKQWRNYWTNIHSLSFDCPSFSRWFAFKDLVINVLQHRKSFDLRKLKFICRVPAGMEFARAVFDYAQSHRLEELDTDAIASLPGQTNLFDDNDCLNLKHLLLVECDLHSGVVFTSTLPQLVTLTISDFRYCKKICITAPRLKFLNWNGESPCLLSFCKCLALDKVDIHMSPPVRKIRKKKWFAAMRDMVKGCCHAKSITVSLNVSKGKFILYYSSADAEIKVVDLNKETGEERLQFAFPMVSGFDLNRFVTILREMFGEKKTQISNQMEIDRLSNLPEHIIHHILSFMDTKHAVQTSVLSMIWRYHWTHIYSLNLECRSNRTTKFKKFVLDVLHHRKPFNLNGLRFHLNGKKCWDLMRIIPSYALSKSLEELDTNLTTLLQSFYQCQTLRTLKLCSCSGYLAASDLAVVSSLTLLTTLELHDVWLRDCEFFPSCLILENLSIIGCVMSLTALNVSAPRLVKLIISNFTSWEKNSEGNFVSTAPKDVNILITAPRLKFFNLKEMDPVVLSMVDCPALEKVDIHRSQPFRLKADDKKKTYILDLFYMVEGLFHVKSLRISLDFPKEKFILCRNNVDEETKIAVLNKVSCGIYINFNDSNVSLLNI